MDCRELEQALCDPHWARLGAGRVAWLTGLAGVEDCVAGGLRRTLAAQDWSMFERWVLAAYANPSPACVPTLCEALRMRSFDVSNEDVVSALDAIRDPASIDCLRELSWEPDWDEFRGVAVKAVHALAAIATPEAQTVLREALANLSVEIREAAAHELAKLG